jgi:NAD(P)-dependent dehydrogenase (short-subunit alcohol dehydrogenase family)
LGCTVIVADIKEDDAHRVAEGIKKSGDEALAMKAVCPGTVATELQKKSFAQSAAIKGMTPEAFLKEFFIDPSPLGRMAQPLDVAQAVSFLASGEASFITGSTLNVAGG